MTNNAILRSIRYLLNVNDARLVDLFVLGGADLPEERVCAFLKDDADPAFVACDDATMAQFLEGLVLQKRGRDDTRPPPPVELPVTNNIVVKKLRVAYQLKDEDIRGLLTAAGYPLSRPELSAIFRKAGQPHYRPCSDAFLKAFLTGLTYRFRR